MALFLSPEWFGEVARATPGSDRPVQAVLEQVVEGAPDGTVTYRVELAGGEARIVWPVPPDAPGADLRLTCDWATASSIAKGELSTQRALMQGRVRVSGHLGRLAEVAGDVQSLDPLPGSVRSCTTFANAS